LDILLYLLGEKFGSQQLIATFSKQVVERVILWLLMDLENKYLFVVKEDRVETYIRVCSLHF
jgi:hypothetical protein